MSRTSRDFDTQAQLEGKKCKGDRAHVQDMLDTCSLMTGGERARETKKRRDKEKKSFEV